MVLLGSEVRVCGLGCGSWDWVEVEAGGLDIVGWLKFGGWWRVSFSGLDGWEINLVLEGGRRELVVDCEII